MFPLLLFVLGIALGATLSPWFFLICVLVLIANL